MLLNLTDPASIVAWWRTFPERHDPYLDRWAVQRPEAASAVREAQRRIAADPELSAMLVKAAAARKMAEWDTMPERLEEAYMAAL